MKLAIITSGMLPIPAVKGGAVETLIDFALEYNQQHRLHDITVYSPWDPMVKLHPALVSTVNHYYYIDVTSLKARILRRLRKYFHKGEYYNYFIEYYFEKIYAHLRHQRYDYIILENCAGFAYKLSLRGYTNLILHNHNDGLNRETAHYQTIFDSFTRIFTCSDYIRRMVSAIQPSDKIQTVYNGFDFDYFSSGAPSLVTRADVGLAKDDFVIVYSGRINEEKGVSELIDAMLKLQAYPDIKLMVIGGTFYGNSADEDEFVCSLKTKAQRIKDHIVFTGFIPYKNVPGYLRLADIAALPSMWDEPFGMTIVEAMAVGLPLITTRSGGIPEICEGVATIVDRDGIVDNLVDAILDLYRHPEQRKLMAEASVKRAARFDKETFAKNYFAAIEGPS